MTAVANGAAASALFGGLTEVTGVLTAELAGAVIEATPGPAGEAERRAASTAVALRELTAVGGTLALGPLQQLLTQGARATTVTAVKQGMFLAATVAPARGTAQVERALEAWTPRKPAVASPPAAASPPAPASPPAAASPPAPAGPPAAAGPPVLRPTPVPAPMRSAPAPARPAAPGAAATTAFSGRLSAFAVPDLLELLRSGRRSGVLSCSSPAGNAAWLSFRDGLITGARSPALPDLGATLIEARKLAPAQLQAAPAQQAAARSAEALGDHLVRAGLVDAPTIQRELARHIEATVKVLVSWGDGEFAFDSQVAAPSATAVPVAIDCRAVLLNVLKELDESSRGPATRAKT